MALFTQEAAPAQPDLTSWTLVREAGSDRDTIALAARGVLYLRHSPAVYAWARSEGMSMEDAQDLTQAFFEHLIATDWFRKARPSLGRFRSFMLTTLQNFAGTAGRKRKAKKRGEGRIDLPIHLAGVMEKVDEMNTTDLTPDRAFLRGWAISVMDETLKALQRQYREDKKGAIFETLSPWVAADPYERCGEYADAAAKLGIKEDSLRVAVSRMREAYRSQLWSNVSSYLRTNDPAVIREELACLAEAC